MSGWLSQAYPWIKSLHIVSVVAWMAGLLYLPRLYVYHSTAAAESGAMSFKHSSMTRRACCTRCQEAAATCSRELRSPSWGVRP